jgi:ferredoxin
MANKDNKTTKNVPGQYYVDKECIACNMCVEIAPDNFKIDDDEGMAYVAVQPATDDAKAQCAEAKNSCPVEAIGDDGA